MASQTPTSTEGTLLDGRIQDLRSEEASSTGIDVNGSVESGSLGYARDGWAPGSELEQQPRPTRRGAYNEAAFTLTSGGLGHANISAEYAPRWEALNNASSELKAALNTYERAFQRGQPRSLVGIANRAFILGIAFTSSLILSLYLAYVGQSLWRAPFFIAVLSTFHFFEFYTTAFANSKQADVSSFLLASNGSAYTIAHLSAIFECIISHYFFPTPFLPAFVHYTLLSSGLFLVFSCQFIRSIAMIHAGSNFSHTVKHRKHPEHRLVTEGIYAYLRHPSYFGYYWWAIGTQLVLGNGICLIGFSVFLWFFFNNRITGEQKILEIFFGDEYDKYKARTRVGIPGIN